MPLTVPVLVQNSMRSKGTLVNRNTPSLSSSSSSITTPLTPLDAQSGRVTFPSFNNSPVTNGNCHSSDINVTADPS